MNHCVYCGAEAEGQHAIHRDGFGVGPEVPLCNACGGPGNPTCEEIWKKIATSCRFCGEQELDEDDEGFICMVCGRYQTQTCNSCGHDQLEDDPDQRVITFVERLFKMQDYYESSVDDDVLDYLRQFYNLDQSASIEAIRDKIHKTEAQRYGDNTRM